MTTCIPPTRSAALRMTRTKPVLSQRRRRQLRRSRGTSLPVLVAGLALVLLVSTTTNFSPTGSNLFASAAYDDDYYNNGDDAAAAGDDAAGDDAAGDDAAAAGDDAAGDDAAAAGDDAAGDDAAKKDADDAAVNDDDMFDWDVNQGFSKVSVMPVSCINYNNGHMIKFDFFESGDNGAYQCRFNHIGSFVVSIAHYMRAYFNNEALVNGQNFQLPGDAGYLNCVLLQETEYAETKLYAKIGCMDRATFTSTKLQLHVYTDAQCSVQFQDGETSKRHSTKGYEINGYYFSTRVSFRPPFYACQACNPAEISNSFNKKYGNWYDDDYISEHGKKDSNNEEGDGDDYYKDDYFGDDAYLYANDDVGRDDDARYYINNDDAAAAGDDAAAAAGDDAAAAGDDAAAAGDDAAAAGDDAAANDDGNNYSFDDDDYYSDDSRLRRHLGEMPKLQAAAGVLESYHTEFWRKIEEHRRSLYENEYDIGDWSMCQRIYRYGVWCDEDCQALDSFRVDEWSKADVFLLVIMCVFMAAMMLLVVARRVKAGQKARMYGDESFKPGLPPLAMALIFILIMGIIVTLAKLKFVNETLVFAVVTCILLFIYMLKLTLFESRRPVLLAAPRHDMFELHESPLNDRFFN